MAGMRSFLSARGEPAVKQITTTPSSCSAGPNGGRSTTITGRGLHQAALSGAIDAGVMRPVAVDPMAHLLVAALSEAAFVIANADHPRKARKEVEGALVDLLEGLRT